MSRLMAVTAAIVLGASPGRAQAPSGADALLAAEPTPGTTALLVEHATRPDVQRHLTAVLRHARPEVRAAATRVIFAVGARGLLPALVEALTTERTPDAAVELTRAVAALGGPERDETIVASWTRLGPLAAGPAAVAFARARGPAALGALPQLRAIDAPRRTIGAFIEATRPDAAVLDQLLGNAVAGLDAVLYRAVLDAAQLLRLPPPEPRLVAGLAADRPPEMRLDAARAALSTWDGAQPLSAALIAAMDLDAPLDDGPPAVDPHIVRELAARLAGRRTAPEAVWRAQIEKPGSLMAGLVKSAGIQRLLTPQELRQLRRALPQAGNPGPPAGLPPSATAMLVQLPDAYPPGFVPAVIAATGCDVDKARGEGLGAGAGQITLRLDGRAARIAPIDTGGRQAACEHATRILLMTHLTDVPPKVENEQRLAVLPFDDEYLACRESQDDNLALAVSSGAFRITPPQKTRHANPVYPETAQRDGVQGIVVLESTIGAAGCVGRLRVVRGVDPRLDLAALLAVMRWRFSPALVDGAPVPVVMTVTVQFSLR